MRCSMCTSVEPTDTALLCYMTVIHTQRTSAFSIANYSPHNEIIHINTDHHFPSQRTFSISATRREPSRDRWAFYSYFYRCSVTCIGLTLQPAANDRRWDLPWSYNYSSMGPTMGRPRKAEKSKQFDRFINHSFIGRPFVQES